jgi:hypothetical protein
MDISLTNFGKKFLNNHELQKRLSVEEYTHAGMQAVFFIHKEIHQ